MASGFSVVPPAAAAGTSVPPPVVEPGPVTFLTGFVAGFLAGSQPMLKIDKPNATNSELTI